MQNFLPFGEYFVTASVGTPFQNIDLIVDTGSSDVWMFGAGSCTNGPCEGGTCKYPETKDDIHHVMILSTDPVTVDASSSTSLVNVPGGQGAFEIKYQTPGSGVRGNYMYVV